MFKQIMLGVGAVIAFFVGISLFSGWIFGNYLIFAPLYEGVRRDVMIESRYYSEATVRNLYEMKTQWHAAKSDDARRTIEAAARHEFSIFDRDRLPPDLQSWMIEIGG